MNWFALEKWSKYVKKKIEGEKIKVKRASHSGMKINERKLVQRRKKSCQGTYALTK